MYLGFVEGDDGVNDGRCDVGLTKILELIFFHVRVYKVFANRVVPFDVMKIHFSQ